MGNISVEQPYKRVTTEGDAKLKMYQMLSYIQEISDTMSDILNEYSTTLKNEECRPAKSRILAQYKFMNDASVKLCEGIRFISQLHRKKKIITALSSEYRADFKLKIKDRRF